MCFWIKKGIIFWENAKAFSVYVQHLHVVLLIYQEWPESHLKLYKTVSCQKSLEIKMKSEEHFAHENLRLRVCFRAWPSGPSFRWVLTLPREAGLDSSMPSSTPGLTPGRAPAKSAPQACSLASLAFLKTGAWAGGRHRAAVGAHPERLLLQRRMATTRKMASVFAGENWSPPEPHRGLGLPWVLQMGHTPINMRRLQQTQKLKQVSLLDPVGQSFIPSLHWLSYPWLGYPPSLMGRKDAKSPSSCKQHSCHEQM